MEGRGPEYGGLLPHMHFGYEHGETGYELISKKHKLVERTIYDGKTGKRRIPNTFQ